MDFKRILVAGALVVGVLWLYQLWLQQTYPEYASGSSSAVESQSDREKDSSGNSSKKPSSTAESSTGPKVPRAEDGNTNRGEEGHLPEPREQNQATNPVAPGQGQSEELAEIRTRITTPLLELGISPKGGDIKQARLLEFKKSRKDDSEPVNVVGKATKGRIVSLESGWTRTSGASSDHESRFQGPGESFHVEPEQGSREVTFRQREDGVTFRKTYTLDPDSYAVDVRFTVENGGEEAWKGDFYARVRNVGQASGSWFLYDFAGPVVFADGTMNTFTLSGLQESGFEAGDPEGWGGVMDRYFLAAVLPETDSPNHFFVQGRGESAYSGYVAPFPEVGPGESRSLQATYYLGPKEQGLLKDQGRELNRAVDYGILSFLSIPLYQVLEFFHGLVGNYGVAIILLTVVIKLIFFPLFSVSYRAMAKMRKVQPELQRIREQHSDDRQKLNEEMMRLYREEKVNPLGGCLPILIQIPVFIALYWVLLESVELRHEPFIWWIQDLTSKDPFYVLPILMGGSMVIQQLLNPSPLDPIQQKIMLALPVVFTVFFMQFPAGLVLYWFSNNLFSIAQQWWIMRKVG